MSTYDKKEYFDIINQSFSKATRIANLEPTCSSGLAADVGQSDEDDSELIHSCRLFGDEIANIIKTVKLVPKNGSENLEYIANVTKRLECIQSVAKNILYPYLMNYCLSEAMVCVTEKNHIMEGVYVDNAKKYARKSDVDISDSIEMLNHWRN